MKSLVCVYNFALIYCVFIGEFALLLGGVAFELTKATQTSEMSLWG